MSTLTNILIFKHHFSNFVITMQSQTNILIQT